MIFVFVAPIVIGTLMFLNADDLKMGAGTVNYGKLITPPVNISVDGIQIEENPADEESTAREKWTLLYIAPKTCGEPCEARIALLKRLRLLTNENMRRLRTVAVFANTPQDTKTLAYENPDLIISTQGDNAANFLQQFPESASHPVYVIDPLGNLMMYYAEETPDIKRMLKDFKRILKYSHIG